MPGDENVSAQLLHMEGAAEELVKKQGNEWPQTQYTLVEKVNQDGILEGIDLIESGERLLEKFE